jgi:hypothetical protein
MTVLAGPSSFDRVVIRLSFSMLRWARRRAVISPEVHALRIAAIRDLERNQHQMLLLVARQR